MWNVLLIGDSLEAVIVISSIFRIYIFPATEQFLLLTWDLKRVLQPDFYS